MTDSQNPEPADNHFNLDELEDIRRDENPLAHRAQAIRKESLRETQLLLYIIGVLTIASYGYLFLMSGRELGSLDISGEMFERALLIVRLICGLGLAVGTFFLIAGFYLIKAPVRLTAMCFVVHIGHIGIMALINPMSIFQGLLLKGIVLISLISSLKLARDYERARSNSAPKS